MHACVVLVISLSARAMYDTLSTVTKPHPDHHHQELEMKENDDDEAIDRCDIVRRR